MLKKFSCLILAAFLLLGTLGRPAPMHAADTATEKDMEAIFTGIYDSKTAAQGAFVTYPALTLSLRLEKLTDSSRMVDRYLSAGKDVYLRWIQKTGDSSTTVIPPGSPCFGRVWNFTFERPRAS